MQSPIFSSQSKDSPGAASGALPLIRNDWAVASSVYSLVALLREGLPTLEQLSTTMVRIPAEAWKYRDSRENEVANRSVEVIWNKEIFLRVSLSQVLKCGGGSPHERFDGEIAYSFYPQSSEKITEDSFEQQPGRSDVNVVSLTHMPSVVRGLFDSFLPRLGDASLAESFAKKVAAAHQFALDKTWAEQLIANAVLQAGVLKREPVPLNEAIHLVTQHLNHLSRNLMSGDRYKLGEVLGTARFEFYGARVSALSYKNDFVDADGESYGGPERSVVVFIQDLSSPREVTLDGEQNHLIHKTLFRVDSRR